MLLSRHQASQRHSVRRMVALHVGQGAVGPNVVRGSEGRLRVRATCRRCRWGRRSMVWVGGGVEALERQPRQLQALQQVQMFTGQQWRAPRTRRRRRMVAARVSRRAHQQRGTTVVHVLQAQKRGGVGRSASASVSVKNTTHTTAAGAAAGSASVSVREPLRTGAARTGMRERALLGGVWPGRRRAPRSMQALRSMQA